MPIDKPLRIERVASAGVMFTREDVSGMTETPEEAQTLLRDIASASGTIGRLTCNREDCRLECSYIDLTSTVSEIDAELIARCDVSDCESTGVKAAHNNIGYGRAP